MNPIIKSTLTVVACLSVVQLCAQAKDNFSDQYLAYRSSGNSEVIRLKNNSDKPVIIFAGPKDELSNPKPRQKAYEAHSTNTIYVSMNEVVCIINEDEKPVSCEDVKAGIVEMEVTANGNKIVARE